MSDSYWRYSDPRQPPPSSIPPLVGKRPRSDYALTSLLSELLTNYCHSNDGENQFLKLIRKRKDLMLLYVPSLMYFDLWVGLLSLVAMSSLVIIHGTMIKEQCGQPEIVTPSENLMIVTFAARSQSGRPMSGGMPGRAVDDPRMVGIGGLDPGQTIKDRTIGFGSGRPEPRLPPDASSTLFVEGLPPDCTCREFYSFTQLTDIFRPFVGYKEVRLVTKEPRYPGGDPIKLCFVDFLSPSHAATSMDALQGYIFDEHDHDLVKLRLQFARYPGARSGGGHRGKR
ncbi:hypothetical protein GOBAR_DD32914 [Gossypium barbadense]|nr:hypothetical protein GOBAR_DD32914 [Gossypium barbadense]